MRNIFVFLGLTFMLGRVFPLTDFQLFLPSDMFRYPRQSMSALQYTSLLWGISLGLPAVAVALYMWRSKLTERIQPGAGLTLLTVGALVVLLQLMARFSAALVPGGGGLFTINALLVYIVLPIKVVLLAGTVLLLANLKPRVA